MTPIRLPVAGLNFFRTADDGDGKVHVGIKYWTANNQLVLIAHMLAKRVSAIECARLLDAERPQHAPAAMNAYEHLLGSGILVDLEAAILGRVPETTSRHLAAVAEAGVEDISKIISRSDAAA